LIHASNIFRKVEECTLDKKAKSKVDKLHTLIPGYLKYLKDQNKIVVDFLSIDCNSLSDENKIKINDSIKKRVDLLNSHYQYFGTNKI
jgi:hypothetical protein